jgi:hypothetical protein
MIKRVGLLAVVTALALPAAAMARIVVNRGMFGVSLGETKTQVRHQLGAPSHVYGQSPGVVWFYERRNLHLGWLLKNQHLTMLLTTNPKQRTRAGVGVGSSKRDVKRLVQGVRCATTEPFTPGADCTVTSLATGRTTFFSITNGKVDSVMMTKQFP